VVVVVVASREVRVGDEGQPTLGHAFEAEKRLYWDTDEDLCYDVIVAADRLSRCRGIILSIGSAHHCCSHNFHQTRWLREKSKASLCPNQQGNTGAMLSVRTLYSHFPLPLMLFNKTINSNTLCFTPTPSSNRHPRFDGHDRKSEKFSHNNHQIEC
jgi:hypothetical protein